MPGPRRKWREWLHQVTLFDDDVAIGSRHDDFADRAFADDEQQAHWFRGTCALDREIEGTAPGHRDHRRAGIRKVDVRGTALVSL
jgi:hypothetical protein